MQPLTVVCWRWRPDPGYRSKFAPETVNVLRAMVKRHYRHEHEFVCVTDDPKGIDPDIRIVPLWNDFADVPSPFGVKNPSCYRRLRAFARDIGDVFGPRFVSLDLDCVIVGDLDPIWNRSEDFIIWGDTNPKTDYNGSMFMLTAGARPTVYESFDPKTSPVKAMRAGKFGSDQGWISYCLGGNEAKWTKADGVYSFRNDVRYAGRLDLPKGARIVFFHGDVDPWKPLGQKHEWVRTHYRGEERPCIQ